MRPISCDGLLEPAIKVGHRSAGYESYRKQTHSGDVCVTRAFDQQSIRESSIQQTRWTLSGASEGKRDQERVP
jgi:hypothetical protein